MSDDLREKISEKELGIGAVSSEPWAYISFIPKNGTQSRVLKFIVIDDMPTIVITSPEAGEQRVQWWGFWNGQWYTDFIMLRVEATVEMNDEALKEATRVLLEQAEALLVDELHEPKTQGDEPEIDPVTPSEAAGANGTA